MQVKLLAAASVACVCCGKAGGEAKSVAPAKVANAIPESALATVTLTQKAEERLGIVTAAVERRAVPRRRTVGGEAQARPGSAVAVSAPVAGTVIAAGKTPVPGTRVRAGQPVLELLPLVAPDRNLQVQSQKDVEVAKTRHEAAKSSARRSRQMLEDGTGDARTLEQAEAELAMAEAELRAAREQLGRIGKNPLSADVTLPLRAPVDGVVTKLLTAPGQVAAQGAPLIELADLSRLWVRVPIYAGNLGAIDRAANAGVKPLGRAATSSSAVARAMPAPPAGDPHAASVDLFFELDNEAGAYLPGQKVSVTLVLQGSGEEKLVVPWSAVIYDAYGGAWVYENAAPQTFTRRRVEIEHVADRIAILSRGPAPGTKVVATGAADLFGTEFGTGK